MKIIKVKEGRETTFWSKKEGVALIKEFSEFNEVNQYFNF